MIDKEWTKFKVRKTILKSNFINPSCQPLTEISHVSHLHNAINIFESGKIQSGLVFDKSKLKKHRTLVVWLSPNDWHGAGGFRYGNVRFNFDWSKIVDGMKFYWVESIAYGVEACRILLTENDYSSIFDRYDPTAQDGPWWHDADNDKHYWNGNYCLEIMIEKDLYVDDILNIDFVDHHKNFCNINPYSCQDCGLYRAHAGARFISSLVSRDCNNKISNLFEINEKIIDLDELRYVFSFICDEIEQAEFKGNLNSNLSLSLPVARATLNAYSSYNFEEMNLLLSLFSNKKSAINSCAKIIAKTLNVSNYKEIIKK